jgi:thiol-disulfide isomerase/thioredoxin
MRISVAALRALIIACLMVTGSLSFLHAEGGGQGINFRNLTLDQALATAKTENKPVYVHGYTDWCHFCMYMKDSVYPDKEVGDFFNSNFICIKINMEKEGKRLNDSLKIHTYPAMLFYDVNGEIMHRAAGRRYKNTFLELGKEALDPRRQMRTFQKKFNSGTATPAEVQFYFRMQEIAGMDAQQMLNDYLMKLPADSFYTQNSWRIMYDIIKDPSLPVVQKMIDNKKTLEEKFTTDSVNNKFINLYNSRLMQYVQLLDSANYEKLRNSILANNKLDIREKIVAWADVNKAKMKSDWETYKTLAKNFANKYAMDDFRRLNDIANIFYERFSADKELLGLAEAWAKKSVSIYDNYKGNHILASIAYMRGDKDEAMKLANHAIEIAKKDNNDYRMTSQLIAVMQQNQGK